MKESTKDAEWFVLPQMLRPLEYEGKIDDKYGAKSS